VGCFLKFEWFLIILFTSLLEHSIGVVGIEYACVCVCVGRGWGGRVMLVKATFNNISVNSFDYLYKQQILFLLNNYLPAFDEHTFKTSNTISPNITIF
jgi:hypothetical protein